MSKNSNTRGKSGFVKPKKLLLPSKTHLKLRRVVNTWHLSKCKQSKIFNQTKTWATHNLNQSKKSLAQPASLKISSAKILWQKKSSNLTYLCKFLNWKIKLKKDGKIRKIKILKKSLVRKFSKWFLMQQLRSFKEDSESTSRSWEIKREKIWKRKLNGGSDLINRQSRNFRINWRTGSKLKMNHHSWTPKFIDQTLQR